MVQARPARDPWRAYRGPWAVDLVAAGAWTWWLPAPGPGAWSTWCLVPCLCLYVRRPGVCMSDIQTRPGQLRPPAVDLVAAGAWSARPGPGAGWPAPGRPGARPELPGARAGRPGARPWWPPAAGALVPGPWAVGRGPGARRPGSRALARK